MGKEAGKQYSGGAAAQKYASLQSGGGEHNILLYT
jgi:hypothetical protein